MDSNTTVGEGGSALKVEAIISKKGGASPALFSPAQVPSKGAWLTHLKNNPETI